MQQRVEFYQRSQLQPKRGLDFCRVHVEIQGPIPKRKQHSTPLDGGEVESIWSNVRVKLGCHLTLLGATTPVTITHIIVWCGG